MTRVLQPHVEKEIRALSLPLLGCLVAMIAAPALGWDRLWSVGLGAYCLGTAALGALSFGHEYSHRTLLSLLSQPVRRERVFLVKMAVVAGMLLTICSVAGVVLFNGHEPVRHQEERLALFVLPVLCGLFFAPWLTMLCRSPIAGTVFAMSIPGPVLLTGNLIGGALYGYGSTQAEGFMFAFLWTATAILCPLAAVTSWRMFMRLEAIDGRGQELRLPSWLWPWTVSGASQGITTRHPIWLLAKKELRLQQMPLVISALGVFGWIAAVWVKPWYPDVLDAFYVVTITYGGSYALLIGSLASAEERHLGTLEWQMLLPVSSSTQWAVKAAIAMGLTLLLALGVPALLASLAQATKIDIHAVAFFRPPIVLAVALLTACGLYVSSFSPSGLRALLVSLPVLLGGALFVRFLVETLMSIPLYRLLGAGEPLLAARRVEMSAMLLGAAFLALLLRFALANHRSADCTTGRIGKQVLWMAGCLTLGVTVLAAVAAI